MIRSLAIFGLSLVLVVPALAQPLPPPPPLPPPGAELLPPPPPLPPLPPIDRQPPALERLGGPQLIDTVVEMLSDVPLSPSQHARILAIADRMQKEYAEAKEFSPLSREQQEVRRAAIAHGKASGLTSQALSDYADEAANVTPRQRGGLAWVRGVVNEFKEKIRGELSDGQKAIIDRW